MSAFSASPSPGFPEVPAALNCSSTWSRGHRRRMGRTGSGNEARWVEATDAVDQVRRRFGPGAVGPAALLGAGGLSLQQTGDQQWGPDA